MTDTQADVATYADVAANESVLAAQLDRARQHRQQLEQEAALKAAAARLAVYQDSLDAYDPKALRRAVLDSWDACVAAAAGTDPAGLGTRLAEHLGAILREGRQADMAREALGHGAVPRDNLNIPVTGADAYGNPLVENVAEVIPDLHARAILEAADRPSRDEQEDLTRRAEAARQDTLIAKPTGYRITAPHLGDRIDSIAGYSVAFADGVAYAMYSDLGETLDAMVRYWRATDNYEVVEIYGGVPDTHVTELRRVA